jgi:hypothetical protein
VRGPYEKPEVQLGKRTSGAVRTAKEVQAVEGEKRPSNRQGGQADRPCHLPVDVKHLDSPHRSRSGAQNRSEGSPGLRARGEKEALEAVAVHPAEGVDVGLSASAGVG